MPTTPPTPESPAPTTARGTTRRGFLSTTAAAAAAGVVGSTASSVFTAPSATAAEIGPQTGATRADAARNVRYASADFQRAIALPAHPDNGDEARYADRSGSYTKALPHASSTGLVDTSAYSAYLAALKSGKYADFDALSVGERKLVDPLAAYAFSPEGADSHAFAVPPAPTAVSAQTQGEMAELYWMALARDIPFDSYASNATDPTGVIATAANDLSRNFSDVRAPKSSGAVTAQTLFRDLLPDSLVGNYVSQYLLKTVPWGVQQIVQTGRRRANGFDQLTRYADWLNVQNGVVPTTPAFDGNYGYLRSGRDLAEWVHSDFPQQAVLSAARIIAGQGNKGDAKVSPGINDAANPYSTPTGTKSRTMTGFVTFGNQAFFDLVCRVSQLALQAAWYQKWLVHRRLRPEEYGGRVDALTTGSASDNTFPELQSSLRDPKRLGRIYAKFGGYLLPQTFVEGAPTHPAYPSGHSTYIAAGVTMIKAFVDGTVAVDSPQQVGDPSNGDNLTAYTGPGTLTINGELDKLVMNIGMARLFAGVHWRSDHLYGRQLGELVAVRALQDLARNYAEPFAGWDLRAFDGATVRITATSVKRISDGATVATTNQL